MRLLKRIFSTFLALLFAVQYSPAVLTLRDAHASERTIAKSGQKIGYWSEFFKDGDADKGNFNPRTLVADKNFLLEAQNDIAVQSSDEDKPEEESPKGLLFVVTDSEATPEDEVRSNFGNEGPEGDINGDGVVDIDDLNAARNSQTEKQTDAPSSTVEPDDSKGSGKTTDGFVTYDLNGDGQVNFDDLEIVRSSFGRNGSNLPADINRDGVIDVDDLNELRNHIGVQSEKPAADPLDIDAYVDTLKSRFSEANISHESEGNGFYRINVQMQSSQAGTLRNLTFVVNSSGAVLAGTIETVYHGLEFQPDGFLLYDAFVNANDPDPLVALSKVHVLEMLTPQMGQGPIAYITIDDPRYVNGIEELRYRVYRDSSGIAHVEVDIDLFIENQDIIEDKWLDIANYTAGRYLGLKWNPNTRNWDFDPSLIDNDGFYNTANAAYHIEPFLSSLVNAAIRLENAEMMDVLAKLFMAFKEHRMITVGQARQILSEAQTYLDNLSDILGLSQEVVNQLTLGDLQVRYRLALPLFLANVFDQSRTIENVQKMLTTTIRRTNGDEGGDRNGDGRLNTNEAHPAELIEANAFLEWLAANHPSLAGDNVHIRDIKIALPETELPSFLARQWDTLEAIKSLIRYLTLQQQGMGPDDLWITPWMSLIPGKPGNFLHNYSSVDNDPKSGMQLWQHAVGLLEGIAALTPSQRTQAMKDFAAWTLDYVTNDLLINSYMERPEWHRMFGWGTRLDHMKSIMEAVANGVEPKDSRDLAAASDAHMFAIKMTVLLLSLSNTYPNFIVLPEAQKDKLTELARTMTESFVSGFVFYNEGKRVFAIHNPEAYLDYGPNQYSGCMAEDFSDCVAGEGDIAGSMDTFHFMSRFGKFAFTLLEHLVPAGLEDLYPEFKRGVDALVRHMTEKMWDPENLTMWTFLEKDGWYVLNPDSDWGGYNAAPGHAGGAALLGLASLAGYYPAIAQMMKTAYDRFTDRAWMDAHPEVRQRYASFSYLRWNNLEGLSTEELFTIYAWLANYTSPI